MGTYKKKSKILKEMKIGNYIRWRPFPLEMDSLLDAPSTHRARHLNKKNDFIHLTNKWQYGIVLDVLHSPRHIDKKDAIPGTHIKILIGSEIDWIFNFELFNEIELIGK